MISFVVKTLGCKVNQCDSQALEEELCRRGLTRAPHLRDAKLVVLNTCCVTHQAQRKSRQAVRRAVQEKGRGAKVCVMGCCPAYDAEELRRIPGVDTVFSPAATADLLVWAQRHAGLPATGRRHVRARFSGRTRAFLKIQEGCDNRCSYCVVPRVRGRSRSVDFRSVLSRARRLVEAGHMEIVLSGTNLGAFRRGTGRGGLIEVIDALHPLSGLRRLRLSSIEAPDVTDALIERMASLEKLCPHLHIPFQSGDDAVLRHMGKRVRVSDYLRLAHRVRKRVPDAVITCDIIAGYPAETQAGFRRTCAFLEEVAPLKTHIFTFSMRRGTPLEISGQAALDARLVRERRRDLEALTQRLGRGVKERFLGSHQEVLVEQQRGGRWEGYTKNYIRTAVEGSGCSAGGLYPVVLQDLKGEIVTGRILSIGKEICFKSN
ncbi:MAG: MiaB/RimO family radical SAM methylthiotransferase [Deltaproteobacteria bacterium]